MLTIGAALIGLGLARPIEAWMISDRIKSTIILMS
jgi:hypothetical protein